MVAPVLQYSPVYIDLQDRSKVAGALALTAAAIKA
jgi:hypothetical protein